MSKARAERAVAGSEFRQPLLKADLPAAPEYSQTIATRLLLPRPGSYVQTVMSILARCVWCIYPVDAVGEKEVEAIAKSKRQLGLANAG